MNRKIVNSSMALSFIVLLSIVLLSNKCVMDRPDCRLKFLNNSNASIRYMVICNVSDTTKYYGSCHEGDISPKTREKVCVDSNWENYFSNNAKLRIYLINKDTLNKYGINEIFGNRIFLKSLSFGKGEADSLNWTITYP